MTRYSVTPIVVGRCDSPEPRLLYLGDPAVTIPTIFTFFLLKAEDRVILVDIGFTAELCERYMPDVGQAAEEDPFGQLEALGVRPDDVDEIVVTHAHWDHLSSAAWRFPNARVHLQRAEYEFVTNPPHPWFRELVDTDAVESLSDQSRPRLVLLDGETEILAGIRSIATPGHTKGHQSILVDTIHGDVCITGDALLNYRNLDEDVGPGFNCNLIDCMRSIATIRGLSQQGVVILAGHDPTMLTRHAGIFS